MARMWRHLRQILPPTVGATVSLKLASLQCKSSSQCAEVKPKTHKEVKGLFSQKSKWQSWLIVETNMAQAQALLGIIPQDAAQEISRVASCIDNFDLKALETDIRKTQSAVLSLVNAMAAKCEGNAGGYIHWGATTQNVILTGLSLQLRLAHAEILLQLADCLDAVSDLANEPLGNELVCAGRTVQRQGLPTTWGFRVAIWAEELARHADRLMEAEERLFALTFGGALGAFHAWDGDCRTAVAMGERLSMKPVVVPSRSSHDNFAEYLLLLGLLSTSVSRIGSELYAMQCDEFAEVREIQDSGTVGSSTMAQKVNPKFAPAVMGLATQVRSACIFPAIEMAQPTRDGDSACTKVIYEAVPNASLLAHRMLQDLANLLRRINPDGASMARNLKLSEPGAQDGGGSLLCSENAMMRLGAATAVSSGSQGKGGRQWAHDVIEHTVAIAVQQNRPLVDVLYEDSHVQESFSKAEVAAMLQPKNYLGACTSIARAAVDTAREKANQVRRAAATNIASDVRARQGASQVQC